MKWYLPGGLALAALLVVRPTLALEVPPRPAGRVTDLASLLTTDQRQALERRLADFERETTHQVAILLIPSLEGEPLEPFSHKVATTWKLGQAGVDNGVLILIAQRDRKIRIEVGYGLEPSLPDGLAGDIIRETIAPKFRQGQYYQGLNGALDRIFEGTRGVDLAAVSARRVADTRRTWGERASLTVLIVLVLFGVAYFVTRRFLNRLFWSTFTVSGAVLVAIALAFVLSSWVYVAGWAGLGIGLFFVNWGLEKVHRCPRCRGWLSLVSSKLHEESSIFYTYHDTFKCVRCGFQNRGERQVRKLAFPVSGGSGADVSTGDTGWSGGSSGWSGGGGESSFSGGGGSFGGGGASGSW